MKSKNQELLETARPILVALIANGDWKIIGEHEGDDTRKLVADSIRIARELNQQCEAATFD